ncbi:MAG: NPCBM/NEW2 domain-containing protein [Pirellulales bacterium]|nr:NPCBM/NEW2 domain-containing protein [Pirellulales bacterium]
MIEITYDTGAKVVIEGPAEFVVGVAGDGDVGYPGLGTPVGNEARFAISRDPSNSGYLASGSLVARCSTKASKGFFIGTPIFGIEDFGTEFGISVTESKGAAVEVFDGSVFAVPTQGSPVQFAKRQLSKGDSIEVDLESGRVSRRESDSTRVSFVRSMPRRHREFLGLLKLITEDSTDCGIDLLTGERVEQFAGVDKAGEHRYQSVGWNQFVDGVFIPDGASSHAVDSDGNVFSGFPATLGRGYGPIWARLSSSPSQRSGATDKDWVHQIGLANQFNPNGGGLLCLHANAGVTFDLKAIEEDEEAAVRRFVAVAGMGGSFRRDVRADVWVLVDGELRWSHKGVVAGAEPLPIALEIKGDDQFLTLAVTDGGNGSNGYDWVVFGEPKLVTETEFRPQNDQK